MGLQKFKTAIEESMNVPIVWNFLESLRMMQRLFLEYTLKLVVLNYNEKS